MNIKIAHISDSHIAPGNSFREDVFSQIVDEINNSAFDLVVHTGDITNTGLREAYERSQPLLQKIEKPLIVIPGNHDCRNVGYELFEKYYNDLNGVYSGDGFILIYVDSSIPDRNEGRVGSTKFEWLKEQLMKYSAKKLKIVAVHHHLIPVPKAGTERNVLYNAGDLIDLFQKYDVDLVLSGHRHYPNVLNVDGMVISNAGCMSCQKIRAGDICSYNQIDIKPEEISVTIRRVGNNIQNNTKNTRDKAYTFPQHTGKIFISEGSHLARVVQIAGTFFSDRKIFEERKYENAVKTINQLNADVVIHCGDIVDVGIPQHYDLAQQYLQHITAPIVYTPGPRDINYIGYELFPQLIGQADQQFQTSVFKAHGITSSQYDSEVGTVGQFALQKLEKNIAKQEQEVCCVYLHHNVIPLPHIREKGLLEDAGDVLKFFCDNNVELVLTGYSSYPYAAKINNTIVSNANAVSCRYVRSLYGNSFNVVDIYENLIHISEIHSLWGSKRILGIWKRNKKEKRPNH
jgi:3',5'-cyclic AMP phosphodiesterase CpdA